MLQPRLDYGVAVEYTFGYYKALNPLRLPFVLLPAGILPPENAVACELGFGQGVSIAMHSAVSPVHWWGTDINRTHVAFARSMVAAAGATATLSDQSFEDFLARPDLPVFDFIGLHGIWAWVSDADRARIVDFVRRKLKPGGVLYVSYNTLPGQGSIVPLRHLLTETLAAKVPANTDPFARMQEAIAFSRRVVEATKLYSEANPSAVMKLAELDRHERNYVAQEYFGHHWAPMHFTDFCRHLAPAGLTFAGSSTLSNLVESMHFTTEQRGILGEIQDPIYREQVKDYFHNESFRSEYWVKEPCGLASQDAIDRFLALRVVMTQPIADVVLKFTTAAGQVSLEEATYLPILKILADHRPVDIANLARQLAGRLPVSVLLEAIIVLMSRDVISPAQDPVRISEGRDAARRFNASLMEGPLDDRSINFLASPVTGGGIGVPRVAQLFLAASARGEPPANWPATAAQALYAKGQCVTGSDGRPLRTLEEGTAHLMEFVPVYLQRYLPMLQGLGIA